LPTTFSVPHFAQRMATTFPRADGQVSRLGGLIHRREPGRRFKTGQMPHDQIVWTTAVRRTTLERSSIGSSIRDRAPHAAPTPTLARIPLRANILFTDMERSSALFERLGDLRPQEILRALPIIGAPGESPRIADWLLERGGFEPPVPRGFMRAEFGPSLAHYSARKKASVLERICSPGIRLYFGSLRFPSFARLTRGIS
jgi:hypothetical protein